MDLVKFKEMLGIQSAESKNLQAIKCAEAEFDVTFRGDRIYIMHGPDAVMEVTDKSMDEVKTLLRSMRDALLSWRGLK